MPTLFAKFPKGTWFKMLVVDSRGGDQLPVHSVPGPARAVQLPHGEAPAAAPAPPAAAGPAVPPRRPAAAARLLRQPGARHVYVLPQDSG